MSRKKKGRRSGQNNCQRNCNKNSIVTPFSTVFFTNEVRQRLSVSGASETIRFHSVEDVKGSIWRPVIVAIVAGGLTPVSWPDGSSGAIRNPAELSRAEIFSAYLLARSRLEIRFKAAKARRLA